MYEKHDVLHELYDEIISFIPEAADELERPPEKGDLDIREVLLSPYFFA